MRDDRCGRGAIIQISSHHHHHHYHHHHHHHLDRQTRACSSSTTSPGLIFLLAKTTRPTPSILNSMKTLFATSWRWGEIGRGWWLWTWKRQMVDRLKLDDGLLCEHRRHTPGWVWLAYLWSLWPWVVLFLFAVIIIFFIWQNKFCWWISILQLDLYGMSETQTADEKDPPDSMAIMMLIMLIKLTLAMIMMRF